MSDEQRLLPCPFCGGNQPPYNGMPWVRCIECDASISWQISDDAAVAAWNARATPPGMIRIDTPELLAMVDALAAMSAMAQFGRPMVATEIMAAADKARAAITAWEKLTK